MPTILNCFNCALNIKLSLIRGFILFLSLIGVDEGIRAAEDTAASMSEFVTCAVYFRMTTASLSARFGSGQEELANIQKDYMYTMMERGKSRATEEFGDEEFGAEMFQDQWQAVFQEMIDEINRNYENVSKLKYRYGNRCQKLVGKSAIIGAESE